MCILILLLHTYIFTEGKIQNLEDSIFLLRDSKRYMRFLEVIKGFCFFFHFHNVKYFSLLLLPMIKKDTFQQFRPPLSLYGAKYLPIFGDGKPRTTPVLKYINLYL